MRGKRRSIEERHELFKELEGFLSMGFSLKKACNLADLPYSTIRDLCSLDEPLRARTRALQNTVNIKARANIINSIEQGNIQDSKWWLERFDYTEPQGSVLYGGKNEAFWTIMEIKQEHETIEEGVEKMKNLFLKLNSKEC